MTENTAPPVVDGIEWVRPRPGRRGIRNDVILALVLAVGTAATVVLYRIAGWGEGDAGGDAAPWWGSVIWVAAMTLPLAARRLQPEIVALVASATFIVGGVVPVGDALFSNICLFVAIYTVGAWSRSRRRATIVRGVIVAGMFGWLFWGLVYYSAMQDYLPDFSREGTVSPYLAYGLINVLTNLLYFGGAWYFGDTGYRSARSRAELEQRTAELASERERTRTQAVAIERLRIARELHDVVAHHVSVIGVQAGAARRVLAKDPAAAATALSAIESSARDAVDELHGLLGTLRGDAETGPVAVLDHALGLAGEDGERATTSTSTRGIARLDELVAECDASGLPTTLAIVGEPVPVSAVVDLSAYRIVQEALTNVRKHAGAAATAEVRVRWAGESVEVEVTNSGAVLRATSETATDASSRRLGQVGMRERVAAAGGRLELGPRSRGGYLVRADFPLRRAEEVPA
ncbi:sensor histidine kinase [Agromyces fucosus]|uniref:histidine kinase n=1 Tax=Agromyces fucosus TaxID=41985 RepID=A0A4Q2JH24_9MICO|nr:histidine kinase [Agromyces fucosus]RXZ47245.1 sensor histidine kinase [Agromyces fucosus]